MLHDQCSLITIAKRKTRVRVTSSRHLTNGSRAGTSRSNYSSATILLRRMNDSSQPICGLIVLLKCWSGSEPTHLEKIQCSSSQWMEQEHCIYCTHRHSIAIGDRVNVFNSSKSVFKPCWYQSYTCIICILWIGMCTNTSYILTVYAYLKRDLWNARPFRVLGRILKVGLAKFKTGCAGTMDHHFWRLRWPSLPRRWPILRSCYINLMPSG